VYFYDMGKSTHAIAKYFGFSKAAVRRVRQRHKEQGTYDTQTHSCGRKTQLTPQRADRMQTLLEQKSNATVADLQAALGGRFATSTIYKWRRLLLDKKYPGTKGFVQANTDAGAEPAGVPDSPPAKPKSRIYLATHEQIASRLGITVQRVAEIERAGLQRLRSDPQLSDEFSKKEMLNVIAQMRRNSGDVSVGLLERQMELMKLWQLHDRLMDHGLAEEGQEVCKDIEACHKAIKAATDKLCCFCKPAAGKKVGELCEALISGGR
jgi:transposase